VPLKEVAKIVTGKTPSKKVKDYYGEDVPFITPAELSYDEFNIVTSGKTYLSEKGAKISYIIPENSVMVCCIGSLGKLGIAGCDLVTNQQINTVIFDENKVFPRYGMYACSRLKEQFARFASSTTISIANKSQFSDMQIPLPSLKEQKQIADILDLTQELIKIKKVISGKLELLEESVFNSMFGNPILNEMEWNIEPLRDHIEAITSGWSPVCENRSALPNEWGILKLSAVTKGFYRKSENKAYLNESFDKLKEVRQGDILMTRKNTKELVGACAYVFETRDRLAIPDIIFSIDVPEKSQTLDRVYFWKLMNNSSFKRKVQNLAMGAAGSMPNISKTKLMELEIPLPPITKQKKFRTIIEQINNSKKVNLRSLKKLEESYQSLLNRAFKGELTKQKVR
jgi:type I restriction enzyme, S subunit